MLREFQITEKTKFQFRFDALNLFNHTTFAGPNTNPFATDFGKVTRTTGTQPRYLQLMAKLQF